MKQYIDKKLNLSHNISLGRVETPTFFKTSTLPKSNEQYKAMINQLIQKLKLLYIQLELLTTERNFQKLLEEPRQLKRSELPSLTLGKPILNADVSSLWNPLKKKLYSEVHQEIDCV